jgi:hypothetical protein
LHCDLKESKWSSYYICMLKSADLHDVATVL